MKEIVKLLFAGLFGAQMLCCFFVPLTYADIVYVDDSNTTGPWLGTSDDPFLTISDGIAGSGPGGWVLVAEGIYHENLTFIEGIVVEGGYSGDWNQCDWQVYLTILQGITGQSIASLSSDSRLEGFLIEGGSIGVSISHCNGFVVRNCVIRSITGTESMNSDGGDACGITIENSNTGGWLAEISNIVIQTVHGGTGAEGTTSHHSGFIGGKATGIRIANSHGISIFDSTIEAVSGGAGGTGTDDDPYASGSGGPGADSSGIDIDSESGDIFLQYCRIDGITGGAGGSSPWGHMAAGSGADGGKALGLYADAVNSIRLEHCIFTDISGGIGGHGGDSGDSPTSGNAGNGAPGGQAVAVYLGSSVFQILNLLIDDVTGGCGGDGGGTFMDGQYCGFGGTGGSAIGVISNTTSLVLSNATIRGCSGGQGGDGGRSSYNPPDIEIPDHSMNMEISTPTPTPTSTPLCWGPGGSGGVGIGIQVHTIDPSNFKYNIITSCQGGLPGDLGTPAPGIGFGIHSFYQELSVAYTDCWNNDFDFYYCSPGPGSFSADPFHVTVPEDPILYLSAIESGQSEDSPCLDAGDIDSNDQFIPGRFTTRTDQTADEGLIDFGFHKDTIPRPTRTPFPSPTITPFQEFSPTPDVPTPTPDSPTSTPDVPTFTPDVPSPTPTCPPTGIELILSDTMFSAGDSFVLTVRVCNGTDSEMEFAFLLVLEAYGQFYFFPSWSTEVDFLPIIVGACSCMDYVALDFMWPDDTGSGSGLCFYTGLMDTDMTSLFGNIDMACFGYE